MQKKSVFSKLIERIFYSENKVIVSNIVNTNSIAKLPIVSQWVLRIELPISHITKIEISIQIKGVRDGFKLFENTKR